MCVIHYHMLLSQLDLRQEQGQASILTEEEDNCAQSLKNTYLTRMLK